MVNRRYFFGKEGSDSDRPIVEQQFGNGSRHLAGARPDARVAVVRPLSACVGTNFNNDGITLYEAMTALFVAQAAGYNLSLGEQITVMLASLLASAGIAGFQTPGSLFSPRNWLPPVCRRT